MVYHSFKLNFGKTIWDIEKTTESGEYAVACGGNIEDYRNGALVFVKLERPEGKF